MLSPTFNGNPHVTATPSTSLSPKKQAPVKFKQPFELYYYRDLLWKVGFSNQLVRQPPSEYPFKVKYFVGSANPYNAWIVKPGENSNRGRGI